MADVKPANDFDYELWLLMTRTHYRMNRARAKELRKYSLSPEQASVLFITQSLNNHAMPIEIARQMLREPQTITSIIDRMAKKGLLKKTKDTARKNVVRVSLTKKGQQAYEQSVKRESIHQIMSTLTDERRRFLKECLEELMKNAHKYTVISQNPWLLEQPM